LKSVVEIWEAALGELQVQVSKPNYDTWLKDTRGMAVRDGIFTVGVPNAFVGEWLNSRLRPTICKTLSGIIGRAVEVEFAPYASDKAVPAAAAAPVHADGGVSVRERPAPVTSPRLNSRYTFESFVPGESNRLSYSSALEIAESPALHYNPLYIHGSTGMGKTHLLQAIAHTTSKKLNTIYMTAEHFTNEFVASVKSRHIEDFRARFHDVEVFILDDIQFLSGREQTQECLLHIFIDLYNNNCRIVIAGDRPPQGIPSLDERLQSRFSWGLVTRVSPPDRETRIAILQSFAARRGTAVPRQVLEYVADRLPGNVRELEGALNIVFARARLSGGDPDMKMASQVLPEMAAASVPQTAPTPKAIIEASAGHFGVSPQSLIGIKRDRKTSLARQVAMFLMLESGYRVADIGRGLGNRDHSTVIHSCRKVDELMKSDDAVKQAVASIKSSLHHGEDSPPSVEKPL
jgi:chromosomal replication initiator protein